MQQLPSCHALPCQILILLMQQFASFCQVLAWLDIQPLSSFMHFASAHDVGFLWPILMQSTSKSSKNDDNCCDQTTVTDTKTVICTEIHQKMLDSFLGS